MALEVESGATLRTGQVRPLFESAINTSSQIHMYAVTRDGKRFLVREPLGSEQATIEPLYIVTNSDITGAELNQWRIHGQVSFLWSLLDGRTVVGKPAAFMLMAEARR